MTTYDDLHDWNREETVAEKSRRLASARLVQENLWLEPEPYTIQPEEDEPYRAQVLEEAKGLITGDRNKSYGSPTQNFSNTADLWNVQFGHKFKEGERFTASDVAQAQILLKMARMIAGPKRDHWVDVAGYAGCGAECEVEA